MKKKFILKGAMLFRVWNGTLHRETRDLDLASFGDSSVQHAVESFRTVCAVPVADDGLTFIDVRGEPLQALEDYGGVRLTVLGKLTAARITIQVDVGFGNRITPPAQEIEFPVLLEFPAPKLRAYPVETVVSEKLQALVNLGLRNSRFKDYFDLWHLGRTFHFDGVVLVEAIRGTFTRRKTDFSESEPMGLTDKFHNDAQRQAMWRAFVKKVDSRSRNVALADIVEFLRVFLLPPLRAAGSKASFARTWPTGGPWR